MTQIPGTSIGLISVWHRNYLMIKVISSTAAASSAPGRVGGPGLLIRGQAAPTEGVAQGGHQRGRRTNFPPTHGQQQSQGFGQAVLYFTEKPGEAAQSFLAAAFLIAANTLLSSSRFLLVRMCAPTLFLMNLRAHLSLETFSNSMVHGSYGVKPHTSQITSCTNLVYLVRCLPGRLCLGFLTFLSPCGPY